MTGVRDPGCRASDEEGSVRPPSVPRLLALSDELQAEVAAAVGGSGVAPSSRRAQLVALYADVAFEHWASQRLLLRANFDVTAFALVRLQFEAVARTTWLVECASEAWIDSFTAPQGEGTLKEPAPSPSVPDMLAALAATAPVVSGMLAQLKAGAWLPMNSYVHSGARSVAHAAAGSTLAQVSAVLRNANGLGLITLNALAVASQAPSLHGETARLQQAYRACLPPHQETG